MYNESGVKTFLAGEDLAARRLVKVESGTTEDPPEVVYADAGEDAIGVTEYAADDGDYVSVRMLNSQGTFEIECLVDSAIGRGTSLYAGANGVVTDASSGSVIGAALEAGVDNAHIEVAVDFRKATTAAGTTIADAGGHTSTSTVEAALQEIYQHIRTAKGIIDIPMPNILNDGTALAQFSDGASATPGYCATAEGMGIRWNNHATPTPVATKVMVPPDMDASSDAVLHILAAKTGDTVGDATKFTVQAFANDVGELYDADADFGGDTDAMTGDATAKTVQEVTLTLASADLTAYPAAVELTVQPKDGTLGTDDVILLKMWIEYQRKILTS